MPKMTMNSNGAHFLMNITDQQEKRILELHELEKERPITEKRLNEIINQAIKEFPRTSRFSETV